MANLRFATISFLGIALFTTVRSAETNDSWTDRSTQLMWTARDNGSGLSGQQAVRYCRDNRTGGYTDWSLPSIEQLQTLVTATANESGYHIKGPLHLSGWQWSSTPGEAKGELWSLDFGDGARASVLTGDSGLNRALCIRSALNSTPH
jgi:hypothetical protein